MTNFGKLNNQGFIQINDGRLGINHFGLDTSTNQGQIEMSEIKFIGLESEGVLENYDRILIRSSGINLVNQNRLHNHSSGVISLTRNTPTSSSYITNSNTVINEGSFHIKFLVLSRAKNSTMDEAFVDLRTGSFWENTGSSEIIIVQTGALLGYPLFIANGAEFLMYGEHTTIVSLGG